MARLSPQQTKPASAGSRACLVMRRPQSLMKALRTFLVLLLVAFCAAPAVYAQGLRPTHAKKGMVVSVHQEASKVGVEIMRHGGNAVDAAVATGFALTVVHPAAGNIGGGGFML